MTAGENITRSTLQNKLFETVVYAEYFHGVGFHSVAYGGHLYLVCAVCDVTIWRHIHVSKATFWRRFL